MSVDIKYFCDNLPCPILPRWYDTGVVEREPGLPLSLLGDRLWLLLLLVTACCCCGGRDRVGEAELDTAMAASDSARLEGSVL